MELSGKLLNELQRRLKIGNRRGVHLNAIPARSKYKFDLHHLSHINVDLPQHFIKALLSELPLEFKISWKDNVPDLGSLLDEDQSRLLNITKAFENLINQTETIESEKGINTFGFGFPILARRDQADNKLTVAPILVWSLRIKRTREFNTWEIMRNEDDPIYINEVLINHLRSDANVEIEQIQSEMLDDGLINKKQLIEICSKLIRSINTTVEDDLEDTFLKKLSSISAIQDKAHYEHLTHNTANSLIDFAGLFSIFEVQKQNIIDDYNSLMDLDEVHIDLEDMVEHSFQSISSVETDPSQQSVLHSLEATRNMLIQGPPGTGKSQTLTAVLINALENNKKTIVVCEKRTALEVLHNALIEKGLHYNCILIRDIVKDRKAVVDSVRERVDNTNYKQYRNLYSKEALDNIIHKASGLIATINKKHQKLDAKLIGNKSWSDVVGDLLSEMKGNTDDINLNIDKNQFDFTTQELNTLLDLFQKGQLLYEHYLPIQHRTFINAEKLIGENAYAIEQQINDDFDYYSKQLEQIKSLFESTKNEFRAARHASFEQQQALVFGIFRQIADAFQQNVSFTEQNNESEIDSLFFKVGALFSKAKRDTLKEYNTLKQLFSYLNETIRNSPDLPAESFNSNLESNRQQLAHYKSKIEAAKDKFDEKILREFQLFNLLNENNKRIESLSLLQEKVHALVQKVNADKWSKEKLIGAEFHIFISDVEALIQLKMAYFNAEIDLFTLEFKWFQFYNALSDTNKKIVDELKPKNKWRKSFLIFYLNSLLQNAADMNLPTHDLDHLELDSTLKRVEKEQLKFIKEFWLSKQVASTKAFEQKNVNLTVENLYNKRSSTRFKRLSLRQIVQYDADLFSNFFPIILTSPDVASNLFKGMNGYFDIVMFDEASQLRLEDNLPAILKGKQIIIAGDEHQMPPSNYFSKVFEGEVEDEEDLEEETAVVLDKEDILLSCESLLDFAAELNFERKHLDFHYRSRHPFLIDFSNNAFYNQRLKPLPNTFDYVPIQYIPVNGTLSDHINEEEAEMVLSILDKNIGRSPDGSYPTIGIATFNIAQRNLIKSKILERQKYPEFEEFNTKMQELEEQGMFIKNLENIQGDERDVIILSTTYGISKDKKFAQRFGPLNHSKGYKLLNVIITRAKSKIYCCTSIPEQVFMNYKEYLDTEGSNNKRAVLYAYLAYCKAISESNHDLRLSVLSNLAANNMKVAGMDSFLGAELESSFEEEVYQSLAERLGTQKLIPQMQFAGFRIDIVYDPQIPGVPRIAIECDGAKYHSSREAYLHDKQRQNILERHGFVFHRIWSTSWWRNPKRETDKLVDYIKSIDN